MNITTCSTERLCDSGDDVQHSFVLNLDVDDEENRIVMHSNDTDGNSYSRPPENDESSLPNIEDVPLLLDSEHLLTGASHINKQNDVSDIYHSAAVSLHSYSQTLPNIASAGLHNYSQPVTQSVTADTGMVLHNYSQPWPQNTDSYTSVHNYCINNDTKDISNDINHETKIYKITNKNDEPLCLKIQFADTYTCHWKDCGLSFNTLSALVEHTSCHLVTNNPGIFTCLWKDCQRKEKPFDGRYRLVQHLRTHTSERPHKCSLCLAKFASAEGLTKHQRVHTGEKPYTCPIPGCKKAFKNSGDKFKHLKAHQVKYPYQCKYSGCTKKYTDPSSLRKHTRTCHPPGNQNPDSKPSSVRRKIQAATLLSNSGSETSIDVSEIALVGLDSTLCSDSNPFLAASGPILEKCLRSSSETQNMPLDLSISISHMDEDNDANIEWIELDQQHF